MIIIPRFKTGKEFHQHNIYSDGSGTAKERAKHLHKNGVQEGIMTNHDTAKGSRRFIEAAAALGIRATTGIELTTRLRENSELSDLHVAGYAFSIRRMSSEFIRELEIIQGAQREKIQKRCEQSVRDPIVVEGKDGTMILELKMPFQQLLDALEQSGKPKVEYNSFNLNDGVMCGPIADGVNRHFGITDPAQQLAMHTIVNIMKGRETAYEDMQRFLHRHNATLSLDAQDPIKRWLPEGFTPYFIPAKTAAEHVLEAGGVWGAAHPEESNLTREELSTLKS